MRIHKEGFQIILATTIILFVINYILSIRQSYYYETVLVLSILLYFFLILFFRQPNRMPVLDRKAVIAPCDGKVIEIKKVLETEYYKDERIRVSIFMSLFNVHINWFPISGIIKYVKHNKGKYSAAWKSKSSPLNEHNSVVIHSTDGFSVMMRQIAGALARRIVFYLKPGAVALQSKEAGFIKFGSRIDVFIPVNSKLLVKEGQKTIGSQTRIAFIQI